MITRLKLKQGEGELISPKLEIGRLFRKKKIAEEGPLGSEAQLVDSFITIKSMVEEMYNNF